MRTASAVALVVLALTGVSVLHAQNNNQEPTKKVIKTLPMVRAGETPSYVKTIGGHRTASVSKPPAMDPYAWITPADTSSVPRKWTLSTGTNIAAFIVKFNRYSVVLRNEDEREFTFPRKILDKAGQGVIDGFEKEEQAAILEAWREKQEEKKAADDARAGK